MALWNRKPKDDLPTERERAIREKYYGDATGPDDDKIDPYEPEDREEDNSQYLRAVENLSASLIKKREIAISSRASCGIERIWREDELAFEGMDAGSLRTRMIDYATQEAPSRTSFKGPRRSQVVINITRPKCETAEGRFSDIQLPTDGKNWGLKVTPVPELMKALKDTRPAANEDGTQMLDEDGKPVTIADDAHAVLEAAKEKMTAMEKEIDDQLNECTFNAECRKAIQSAVRIGTGILKGPVIVRDLKKNWETVSDENTTVRVLNMIEDFRPSSKSVDPWDVFPDPECREDIRRAAYIWERETILPRELREFMKIDGYLPDQIEEILKEEPSRLAVAEEKDNQYLVRYEKLAKGNAYEKWEYNGDLEREDLEALGCDCDGMTAQSVSACVVMVNDRPIKAMLNPIDTGEIPYDFFQWTRRSGVPWGIGVAREIAWLQRIIIAAWRAMMDNAGDSSGANIVVGEGVEPIDGKWEITGKKLWRAMGDQEDVTKAFQQFQILNNQKDLQSIIEMALRFIDIESNLPMLFTGEKGELPETLGATNIMVDSSNVAVRSRVKLWDDYITRPHIGIYYDWNMQYNEKEDIKGDYKVDARGTSILKERDQQGQSIEELIAIRADPELSAMVDWEKDITQLFSARNMDVLHSEEKIDENLEALRSQPAPADPTLEAAKIRVQGELEKVQINQQSDMEELKFKAREAEINRRHDTQMAVIQRDIKMMELSASTGIELDKIKAELTIVSQKLKTQVNLAKDKDTKAAPQVATPLAEPAGRAREGHSFQD